MGTDMLVALLLCGLMLALSVVLLMGKGSFLIAGYNTAKPERRARYDEKRLCRIVGGGLMLITLILLVSAYYGFDLPAHLRWLMPFGIFGIVVVIQILAHTVAKKKG